MGHGVAVAARTVALPYCDVVGFKHIFPVGESGNQLCAVSSTVGQWLDVYQPSWRTYQTCGADATAIAREAYGQCSSVYPPRAKGRRSMLIVAARRTYRRMLVRVFRGIETAVHAGEIVQYRLGRVVQHRLRSPCFAGNKGHERTIEACLSDHGRAELAVNDLEHRYRGIEAALRDIVVEKAEQLQYPIRRRM
jgi:hypothetical protein